MQNMIKLTALLLMLVSSLTTTALAQYDDDIYFSPSAEKKAKEAALKATMWSTDANNDWDIDGYNRRYSTSTTGATNTSSATTSGSFASLNKGERDTVYIVKNNYYFSYADLLYRFHGGFYRPSWYWHTAWGWGDPFFWDRWYYDPFYWDSPFLYASWGWGWGGGYIAWHSPHHYHYGWRPAPHIHHHAPVHRLPAHRVGGGHHTIGGGGHGNVYHSPVIARGGDRHSAVRGGYGGRGSNGSRGTAGSREGIGSHSGSRGQNAGSRGDRGQSPRRSEGSRGNWNNGSHSGSRGNWNSGIHSGSRGGSFGGGYSGGGHSGGGHSGGGHSGGSRGRR